MFSSLYTAPRDLYIAIRDLYRAICVGAICFVSLLCITFTYVLISALVHVSLFWYLSTVTVSAIGLYTYYLYRARCRVARLESGWVSVDPKSLAETQLLALVAAGVHVHISSPLCVMDDYSPPDPLVRAYHRHRVVEDYTP
jgi:hypothetical protein